MEDAGKEGKEGGQVVKRCFYAERKKRKKMPIGTLLPLAFLL